MTAKTILRLCAPFTLVAAGAVASAQALLPNVPPKQFGGSVTPAYEGWYDHPDGTHSFLIGYFSRNTEREIDVPIGPNNHFEPGNPDMGQPTHFLPGRRYGMFVYTMPKEFTKQQKLTWVLTANGVTTAVPFYMSPDYNVTPGKSSEASPGGGYNVPPTLRFSETGTSFTGPVANPAQAISRTALVGEPMELNLLADDDALYSSGTNAPMRNPPPPVSVTLSKYRGPGTATFGEAHPKFETLKGGKPDQPYSGKTSTTVKFGQPGDYMLHVTANDYSDNGGGGSVCCWTTAIVKVVVKAAAPPTTAGLAVPFVVTAAQAAVPAAPTFTKDIAPILQRSCENCHRAGGVAAMSLSTYEEVRPWARAIKQRTGIGPRAGVMPPWYVEKNIGIQQYKDDPSLSDEEIATIARWADGGAPRGNPADMPPPRQWADNSVWAIGTPDLIVRSRDIVVKANTPDWWGEIEPAPTGLTEDRYVVALEIKEVNDTDETGGGRATVGGRFVWHHLIYRTQVNLQEDSNPVFDDDNTTNWPVHEVGRNPDFFDPKGAKLLKAGSYIVSDSLHTHSNGRDTTSHLEFGYKFMPKGYQPEYKRSLLALGNGVDIDVRGLEANQLLHAYSVLQQNTKILSFEPHLHAPGARMCLEAIWGYNIQTLSCVGYDHNWVRGYSYADAAAPLLPKGTILHIIGYMDNSVANKNVPDPRNWSGSGNRSISNMFLDLGNRVSMTDEQFQDEMAKRRERLHLTKNDVVIGCPLCLIAPTPAKANVGPPQQ